MIALVVESHRVGSRGDHDRLLLDIATRLYLCEGSREQAFRDEAEMTAVRAWQRVVQLVHDPTAALAEPEKMGRLRRILEQRMTQRRAS